MLFFLLVMPARGEDKVKVLHVSFHKGCVLDINVVAQELGLDLTNWHICNTGISQEQFEGVRWKGGGVHNINSRRAKNIWERHKDFFNSFDCVMTSDTTPLCRIFLENGWEKPIIIWVCNRFNYVDYLAEPSFGPREPYYELINRASSMKNVRIVPYTKLEYLYARAQNVFISDNVIKPHGRGVSSSNEVMLQSPIGKEKIIFVHPRYDEEQMAFIKKNCESIGFDTYSGIYASNKELCEFIGVLYFPYNWSNFSLFENACLGIVHFVPSEKFILENKDQPIRYVTDKLFYLCEWYAPENRDLFVYFDSWQDLKNKIQTTNFYRKRNQIKSFACKHYDQTMDRWRNVFKELFPNNF